MIDATPHTDLLLMIAYGIAMFAIGVATGRATR